jgi:hypothetical protein
MNLTQEEQKRVFQTLTSGKNKYYVYALCHKNHMPFYIGKGTGERVTQHIADADAIMSMVNDGEIPEDVSEKLRTIIKLGDVECVIIKWGLSENEAYMCESALINLVNFPQIQLTNIVNGHASEEEKNSRSEIKTKARTLEQFLRECAIETKDISGIPVPVAFVKINTLYEKCLNEDNSPDHQKIKDAVRAMWSIGGNVKKYAKYVFALYQQRVVGIFNIERISDTVANEWNANKLQDFPSFPPDVRQIDKWKAQFSSFAEAQKVLNSEDYEIFKNKINDECKKSKTKKSPEERLTHEQSKVFFILGNNVPAEIMSFYNCRLHKKDSEKYFTGQTPVLNNLEYFDLKQLSKKNESAKRSKNITATKKTEIVIHNAESKNWESLIQKTVFCGKHWSVATNSKSIYSYLPENHYLTFKISKSSKSSVKIEFGILSEYQKDHTKAQHIIKIGELKKQLSAFIEDNIIRYGDDSFVLGFDQADTYFVLKPTKKGNYNISVNIEDIEAAVSAFEERLINCGLKTKLQELCK